MTNYSHPKCYARALCNCSKTISQEHYISASVLRLLGDIFIISNVFWLPDGKESDPLPIKNLGSKILCKHHNETLSGLDACAESFFREIYDLHSDSPQIIPLRSLSIDGNALELWALKAYCGVLASGILAANGRQIKQTPPREWLDNLFSGVPIKKHAGLYTRKSDFEWLYRIGPVQSDNLLVGGGFSFAGLDVYILMDSSTEKQIRDYSTGKISSLPYRPRVIRYNSMTRNVEIELKW